MVLPVGVAGPVGFGKGERQDRAAGGGGLGLGRAVAGLVVGIGDIAVAADAFGRETVKGVIGVAGDAGGLGK